MPSDPRSPGRPRPQRLRQSIEIGAPVERVFERWTRYEELPRWMHGVRRTKRIDERRVLWDVAIAGRQLVWEAAILECVPGKLVRWVSTWGAPHAGEVRFEALGPERTRVELEIGYRPRGLAERLGARIGLLDQQVRCDLERFRLGLERSPGEAPGRRSAGA